MTTTQAATLDQPQTTDQGDDDDLTHIYCTVCMPEATHAICGKNLTHDEYLGDYEGPEPDTCVVCAELIETHTCRPHK